MSNRILLCLLFLSVLLTAGFFWGTDIALGIPGEWTWKRIPYPQELFWNTAGGWITAWLAGVAYIGFVWLGSRRMASGGRVETGLWLSGLVGIGFAWLIAVQEAPPGGYRLSKHVFVFDDPGASGYFASARQLDLDSLADYERSIRDRVLHEGTHPPGLVLCHWSLIRLCEASPSMTSALLSWQPASVAEAFGVLDDIRNGTAPSTGNPHWTNPLADHEQAALWLAALLTQLAGLFTVVPLFLLLRRMHGRQTSWRVTVFWPLVPALAVFLPKSDALYPFVGMLFLWVCLEGFRRRRFSLCLLAGLIFGAGMLLSLAMLPVGLLAGLMVLWERWSPGRNDCPTDRVETDGLGARRTQSQPAEDGGELSSRQDHRRIRWGLPALGVAAGGMLPVVAMKWAFDVNLLNVWALNYQNHQAFYDQFPRTYWTWLLVNPLELALSVGLPVAVLVGVAFGRVFSKDAQIGRERLGPYVCCAAVWGLLWLSGKNSGEAARLWLFLQPWAVWLTAEWLEAAKTGDGSNGKRVWFWALVAQTAVCLATVTRVSGFHYGSSID